MLILFFVIVIDGFSGFGKLLIFCGVVNWFGLVCFDIGLMYCVVVCCVVYLGIDLIMNLCDVIKVV